MYLIMGLGNPGLLYKKTRHNMGFLTLDALAGAWGIRIGKRGMQAKYGEGVFEGEKVVLLKPQTYMNLSGDCAREALHYYHTTPDRLIVIYDDIDLPIGSLRIRQGGSAGSHNGARSIVGCVGEDFIRVRIGIGSEHKGALKNYVLGKPQKEEQALLDEAIANAALAVKLIVNGELTEAQARYNKKHEGAGTH